LTTGPARTGASKLGISPDGLAEFQLRSIEFLRDVARPFQGQIPQILIVGIVGPRGDAYHQGRTITTDEAEEYHSVQIETLRRADVDLVGAMTFNNVPEGVGVARAAAKADLPLSLSFMVDSAGRLITGPSLKDAVETVEEQAGDARPDFYGVNCAHPVEFEPALVAGPWLERVRGLRPNASMADKQALCQIGHLEAGDPEVDLIIDAATGPSPDQAEATEFFTTAARNLQQAGAERGVEGILVVSIIGTDHFNTGYNAAKVVQERAHLNGPVPARILRAAQFHEFVAELVKWSTQGDTAYLPPMRTQLVAARSVAEALADLVDEADSAPLGNPIAEVAGPREENLLEVARLLTAQRGNGLRIEAGEFFEDPEGLYPAGAVLPGPLAKLAGPTYEEWLNQ
jgi:uncharacterized protein YbjT (DUF2867 family)